MINLSCPKCTTELEIDDGFAGGICRCYQCGTLMTVPAKAEGQAEMLTRARPDRPDRPESPVEGSPAEEEGGRAEVPASATAPQPTSGPEAEAGGVPEAEGGGTTLVTSTGREVRISEDQLKRVAVARRRRVGIRVGTMAVIILVIGGLAAAAVLLGLNLLRSVEQTDLDRQQGQADEMAEKTRPVEMEDVFTYDPYANPYLVDKPNVFGLPLEAENAKPLAVVVDTSYYMAEQLGFVRTVLPTNLRTLETEAPMQLWLSRSGEVQPFPETPTPPGEWDVEALSALLSDLEASGEQAMLPAVERAIEQGASHLVLVCHFKPTGEQLGAIRDRVAAGELAIDVLQLGRSSSDLRDLAESFDGRYASIPQRRLDDWRREYEAEAPEEPADAGADAGSGAGGGAGNGG